MVEGWLSLTDDVLLIIAKQDAVELVAYVQNLQDALCVQRDVPSGPTVSTCDAKDQDASSNTRS
jgi:hypothetical protein